MEFVWDIPPLVVPATQFLSKALVPNLDHIRYVSATEECWASMSFFGLAIIANLNLKLWAMEMECLESVPFSRVLVRNLFFSV